ncbi:MAG TPA: ASKHA domain-containing protein [Rhodocyclaceae bacterium]
MPNLSVLLVHTAAGDLRLEMPPGRSVREILDATASRVRAACGSTGSCGACLVTVLHGAANPPTLAEYRKLTAAERAAGLRLACQLRPAGDMTIRVDHPAADSAWRSIAPADLAAPPAVLAAIQDNVFGVAVDLGTTHLRVSFWDRKRGVRIASRRGPNLQADFGADVLNRLHAAHTDPAHAAELARLARAGIMDAVRDILARDVGEVGPMLAQIGAVVVAGNTAMLALLAGRGVDALLDPANWQSPIDTTPHDAAAFQAEWGLPNAAIRLLPPLAGFVGSDLLADLVAMRMGEQRGPELLLDVGTNSEIALWDGERLRVTSVPGGPAFEGMGIRHGMAAEPGAIFRVSRAGDAFECAVVDGGEARGLCGTGLLDAVAVLLETGDLKPSGRFAMPPGPAGYLLLPGNERSAVCGADVDAFQRAKAAAAAAMSQLMDDAGLCWNDLSRLCICGAFGRRLDVRHAQATGLLPPVEPDRIELAAEATLAGCEHVLLNEDVLRKINDFAGAAHPINLSFVREYESRYVDHLRLRPMPYR